MTWKRSKVRKHCEKNQGEMNKRWYICSGPLEPQSNYLPSKANFWRANPQEGITWRTQKEVQEAIAGSIAGLFTLLGRLYWGFKSNPGEQVFLGMSRKHPSLRHYHASHRHEAFPFLKCFFSPWISIIWNVTAFPVPTVTTMCHIDLVNYPLTDTKSKPGKITAWGFAAPCSGKCWTQTWVQVCLGHWSA